MIHTTRDPEQWYESVSKTVYRGVPKGAGDILRMIKNSMLSSDFRKVAPVFMHNEKIIWKGQFENRFSDKDFAIAKYLEHEAEVKRLVPAKQLLVYNISEGWAPLCDFLDVDVPETAFPKSNQRDEFNRKMDMLLLKGKFVE